MKIYNDLTEESIEGKIKVFFPKSIGLEKKILNNVAVRSMFLDFLTNKEGYNNKMRTILGTIKSEDVSEQEGLEKSYDAANDILNILASSLLADSENDKTEIRNLIGLYRRNLPEPKIFEGLDELGEETKKPFKFTKAEKIAAEEASIAYDAMMEKYKLSDDSKTI